MFDIGFSELLIIAALGLLILGPERLPSTIRTLARWWRQIKTSVDAAKQQVENEINYSEMTRQYQNYKESAQQIGEELTSLDDIDAFNHKQGQKHATTQNTKASATGKSDSLPARKQTTSRKKKQAAAPKTTA